MKLEEGKNHVLIDEVQHYKTKTGHTQLANSRDWKAIFILASNKFMCAILWDC